MNKGLCVFLLLLLLASMGTAETDEWEILQPGWWNASKDGIVAVRDQLLNHIRTVTGQEPVPFTGSASQSADWTILQPGWWNSPLDDIQAVEKQLSNHIDVLEGRLTIIGTEPASQTVGNIATAPQTPLIQPADQSSAAVSQQTPLIQPADQSNAAVSQQTPLIQPADQSNAAVSQQTPLIQPADQSSAVLQQTPLIQPVDQSSAVSQQTPLIQPADQSNINATQLAPLIQPAASGSSSVTSVMITSDKAVNIRANPDTSSNVYGQAKSGDVFTYLETTNNGWYKILLTDGQTAGYVSGKLAVLTTVLQNTGSPVNGAAKDAYDSSTNSLDPQAYQPIDFDTAYGDSSYLGKKTIVAGVVEQISTNGNAVIFSLGDSTGRLWTVQYTYKEDDDRIEAGDMVTVLGVIRENTGVDSATNMGTITVEADFVEPDS